MPCLPSPLPNSHCLTQVLSFYPKVIIHPVRFSLVSHLPPILSLPSFVSGRGGEEWGGGGLYGDPPHARRVQAVHTPEAVAGRASSVPGTVWHCASVGWANPRANPPRLVVLRSHCTDRELTPSTERQRPGRIQATKPAPYTAHTVLTGHETSQCTPEKQT